MHHSALLVAAGLICPVLAAPNVNNRPNLRLRGQRQRQLPTPILSVGPAVSVNVSIAADPDSTTSSPDSTTTVDVDPVLPPLTSTRACSVIRITEYVTVYGTPVSSSSPENTTSSYGWSNSTVTLVTTTSEPYYPISNSTTATSFGTGVVSVLPTFINVSTTVNYTIPPISYSVPPVVVPSNFTSFPNISTPDVSVTVLPTPVLPTPPFPTEVPGNMTTFANVTSVPLPTATEEPTTVIVPPITTSSSASLVINPSESPIEVATSTATSTRLVIVTSLPPIDTASTTPSEVPTTVVTATNTVSDDAPTGTPSPQEIHCGIKGTAIGVYYLATYAYNKVNVPVTLQGCYQFCSFAVEQCYSYEYYLEPGLGAPRCKLYGGLVAYEVESIDPFQPYQWFDVACGDPTTSLGTK
ncbi:hypothetical protein F5883DRAFT_9508 [Diaporthe sp. PMI_573]|nr:hypothetical protein F5883DRAFT_9508 [Diaporthaceae sp. PMI_573]